MPSIYPSQNRSAWIVAQRPPPAAEPDPFLAHGAFLEEEKLAGGEIARSGVILLTNKQCPWRCLMCDLWQHTTSRTVPVGAIPRQIERALAPWSQAGVLPQQLKLYNSGSFFDPAAIPPADYGTIARQVRFASEVVVECHPRLVGERMLAFRDLLPGRLEVAMGLETAHPAALERLNKRFDPAQFARAADFLRRHGVALRVFLLVDPPFMPAGEAGDWLVRSAAFAHACGAGVVSLIPVRPGNGAIDRLVETGEFALPTLPRLEAAFRDVLALRRGRVFCDTWDIERFSTCSHCLPLRRDRLTRMNLTQQPAAAAPCAVCGQP